MKEKFPVSEALRQAADTFHQDPHDFFLGDSDDYELIITCRMEDVPLIRSLAAQCELPVPLTEVGRISAEAGDISLILPDGSRQPVSPSGWDHFRLG